MSIRVFSRLSLFAMILAFAVVVLGAYVRLSNAGLGCPDWPGCYGHLSVPAAQKAQSKLPDSPLIAAKAWKEMIHRYLAGSLGLMILTLAVLSLCLRKQLNISPFLPWLLVGLVVFQALLGRWTVTLKLHPLVVMTHLLGGLSTLGILGWMTMRLRATGRSPVPLNLSKLRPWAIAGLLLLLIQISLGGWMSANYASLACPDFPTCQGQWWPPMNFHEAFGLLRQVGPNYEGGLLDSPARIAIHMMHRLGAGFVFLYLLGLSLAVLRKRSEVKGKGFAKVMVLILVVQVSLGISNILFHLPLGVATAHNAGAALLLLSLLGLIQALPSAGST
jgi:cytochrome c oxidase assembly protein subunit 15